MPNSMYAALTNDMIGIVRLITDTASGDTKLPATITPILVASCMAMVESSDAMSILKKALFTK